jgi:hypothetical protein
MPNNPAMPEISERDARCVSQAIKFCFGWYILPAFFAWARCLVTRAIG